MADFNAARSRTKRPLPLWVDAFQRDTQTLAADEIGVYFLLLMAMWSRETCDLEDDDERLARVARVSKTVWMRRYSKLMRTFFLAEAGIFWSKRLKNEAEFVERTSEEQSNRKAGKNTEKSPPKPLKNNDTAQTTDKPRSNHGQTTDTSTGKPRTNLPTTYNLLKEEEDARGDQFEFSKVEKAEPISPGFIADLLQAVGVDTANPPPFWTGPGMVANVRAWTEQHGLTPDQIIAGAKDSRSRNPDPPDGPKALDKWMERLGVALRSAASIGPGKSQQKAEAKAPPSPEERMDVYAKAIKEGSVLGRPQHVTVQMAQALLQSGRVTIEDLRKRGIAA